MGYKTLHLLILAFVVVFVQAESSTPAMDSNLTENTTVTGNSLIPPSCIMDTDFIKMIITMFSALMDMLSKTAPKNVVDEVLNNFNCLLEAKIKVISYFIEVVANFVSMLTSILQNLPNTDLLTSILNTVFNTLNSLGLGNVVKVIKSVLNGGLGGIVGSLLSSLGLGGGTEGAGGGTEGAGGGTEGAGGGMGGVGGLVGGLGGLVDGLLSTVTSLVTSG